MSFKEANSQILPISDPNLYELPEKMEVDGRPHQIEDVFCPLDLRNPWIWILILVQMVLGFLKYLSSDEVTGQILLFKNDTE